MKKVSAGITAAYAFALDFDLAGWASLGYLVEEKLIVSGLPVKPCKGYRRYQPEYPALPEGLAELHIRAVQIPAAIHSYLKIIGK